MNQSTNESNQEEFIPNQNHWLNLVGFIRTIEEIPTYTPRNIQQQFLLITNGGSSRAYLYDTLGRAWRYTQLT